MKKYLALDFGGTFVKYCIIDESGEIFYRGKEKAPLNSIEQFKMLIVNLYNKNDVSGIAISMPGIINPNSGYAFRAGSYKKLINTNIYELLKDDIDVPIAVENDGKAAALAELWKGKLKNINTGVVITIGTGLGGGIVMDNKLQKGSHFAAGEITGMLLSKGKYSMDNTAAMNCGMSSFLLKLAKEKNINPNNFEISSNLLGDEKENIKKINGREVMQWVIENDEITIKVYNEWIKSIVFVLLNLKIILDPEKILIGGGISENERFMSDLQKEFLKAGDELSIYKRFDCIIDSCMYKADANLIGALYNWLSLYSPKSIL